MTTTRCALQAGHGGQCLTVETTVGPMLGECKIAQTPDKPCAECEGTGISLGAKCLDCGGSGKR